MSAADLTETRPVGIEDKNAAAHRVGDVDGTALVHCDVGGKPESGFLERKERLPLRGEFVDEAIARISHVNSPREVHYQTDRPSQLAGAFAFYSPFAQVCA